MAATSPLNKIERAHQMYRDGNHEEALGFYTEALSMAKTKAQKIALHSNRAACYLKLHNFKKAAEECTLVLELDHNHTGALMLRAQTLVTLKEYHSALFDVNRLMELNPSSDMYQNLQARLKTQLSLAPILECEEDLLVSELDEEEEEEEEKFDEEEEEKEEKFDEEEEEIDEREQQQEEAQSEQHQDAQPGQQQAALVAVVDRNTEVRRTTPTPQAPASTQSLKVLADPLFKGCKEIPIPKGHSKLDYSRWDRVEDDSSEEDDEDDEEDSLPQYRFRVRTVGVRPVK
ncbi:Tetratricopeptide repeat (TPR)-like superfamily protein [Thalictrum thalictroides]|uniref:Tetratricopeptide repeat (TPR)-like superfamily protein n=1 Tax=Thalictrum thalictroides TaxID=46969 RepID=A0A7J6WTX2_THATH|nr:Tetratricopeptide repeat (TPR)-like superfamily protein [Thalictrum thalictroides]